jgi:hypothetical protein
MNVNGYVVVQSFMVNDLHLKGNELMAYAVIYGFSQDGESWFTGSRSYIAEWCGASKNTVSRALSKLVDKGLIERRDNDINGMTFVDYRAVGLGGRNADPLPKMSSPIPKMGTPPTQNGTTPLPKMVTHNTKEHNLEHKAKERGARFEPPSLEEVEAYAKSRNSTVDPKRFYDYFQAGNWHDAKGDPVRNWKQKLITWERRDDGKAVKTDGFYADLF